MRRINKKINELYVTKSLVLNIPYRGKTRNIQYYITNIFGTQMEISVELRSKKYPCEIPKLGTITMQLKNEFPTKKLLKQISKNKSKT